MLASDCIPGRPCVYEGLTSMQQVDAASLSISQVMDKHKIEELVIQHGMALKTAMPWQVRLGDVEYCELFLVPGQPEPTHCNKL